MRRIGAGIQVLGEQFLALQVSLHARLQHREFFRREAVVDLAPPDVAGDRWLVHHELVLRRAAGVHAGRHHQRAVLRQPALIAAHRLGDQRGGGQVGMHRPRGVHAGAGERLGGEASSSSCAWGARCRRQGSTVWLLLWSLCRVMGRGLWR